ncbi:MAG: glycerophosphodiester phosphodiesterase [bacterium]|nr:glycerophosphodiester phosphodiesterase [bacterium]
MSLEIIAHRGASGTRPENTLPAFLRAVELDAHMIELDVQLSADGAVIVLHDDTLDRTTSGLGPACARTAEVIAGLDAGAWFAPAFAGTRVPTLAQVLAAVPIPLNVELKPGSDDGLEARTLAVVREAGALGRVVFSSFDGARLGRLRALAPDAELAVLWSRTDVSGAIARARGVGARALHIRNGSRAPIGVTAGRAAGLAVRVWTVNDPRDLPPLARAGVAGIFTDFPERFLHQGQT